MKETRTAMNYFSGLLESGCCVGEVWGRRAPGARWVGGYHRRREDRLVSFPGPCPSCWDRLDVFLECSAQRREPQGPRQGHLPEPVGGSPGSSCPGWTSKAGTTFCGLCPWSEGGAALIPRPMELYPRKHFQALLKLLTWLYLTTQPPLPLHSVFSLILLFCVEGGKWTSCPTGAGPRTPFPGRHSGWSLDVSLHLTARRA